MRTQVKDDLLMTVKRFVWIRHTESSLLSAAHHRPSVTLGGYGLFQWILIAFLAP